MIKRRKPKPFGIRQNARIRSPAHLKWIRGFPCAVPGCDIQDGKYIEAAHARLGTDGALSIKPSDSWALPLCFYHHRRQHDIGEPRFEKEFGINMKKIAAELWRRSPARVKMEREGR